ncbi:MAG: hypothetical protein AAB400_03065 [Patescibacteria group bacterium]
MTSADLFAFLTTFSVVVVSCFACSALYYLIQILKRIYQLLDAIEDSCNSVSKSWDSFMHRFSTISDSFQLFVQGIKTASSMYQKYKKSPKRKKAVLENKESADE